MVCTCANVPTSYSPSVPDAPPSLLLLLLLLLSAPLALPVLLLLLLLLSSPVALSDLVKKAAT
jgi:hypothetical protein